MPSQTCSKPKLSAAAVAAPSTLVREVLCLLSEVIKPTVGLSSVM